MNTSQIPTAGRAPLQEAEIELFKPGTYQATNGSSFVADERTLEGVSGRYDPAIHDAPVVVGHPEQDAPAYGWVKSLRFADGALKATLHRLDPAFKELVRSGKFRKVSASFFNADSPANPTPGQVYLRHVGFLGAAAPAVPGLKPVEFAAEAQTVEIEARAVSDFVDGDARDPWAIIDQLTRRVSELEDQVTSKDQAFAEASQARVKAENAIFAETMFREGRLEPAYKPAVEALLNEMDGAAALHFTEGGETVEKPAKEAFKALMKSRPKVIHFGEFAAPDPTEAEVSTTERMAARVASYQEEQRQKGRSISFTDAFEEIKGEFSDTA